MTRNSEFLSVCIANYRGCLRQEYNSPIFCDSVEKLLSSGFTSQPALTTYPDRKVYRLQIQSGDVKHFQSVDEVYVKYYQFTTLKQLLQTLFQVNKAQKSWRIARTLLKKGVSTPRPVAYLTRRRSFLSREHILITEGITTGLSLRDYVRTYIQAASELPRTKEKLSEKRLLIRSVAEFLGKLHLVGIYHGDFTASNIFVAYLRPGHFQIYLIDLDSVRSTRWILSRRRLKNLDELGRNFLDLRVITTSDRIRFLKHYLKIYTKEDKSLRQLFNEIWQRTQFRLKKHHQQFIH
jgi:tRNA A-37 threonylcarbamoyl transferase component Bud32